MKAILTAAISALAVATTVQGQQFYNFTEGLAEGISDNGVVTGSFEAPEYFVWTVDSGFQLIGGAVPGDGIGGQAKISNDGRYISGTIFNAAQGYHEMARYDRMAGMWTGLGGIGGQTDQEISSGWAVSGNGQHVAGLGWIDGGTAHATQWSSGVGIFDLGSTVAGASSRANGLDYDGNVAVGWQDGAGRQGAVWVDGVQELIFKEDGVTPALEAFAVSDSGEWVTGFDTGGFFDPGAAYRYNTVTDTYESLPNLDIGAQSNMAGSGITADGSLIVGGTWGFGPALFGLGLVWEEGVGTMSAIDFFNAHGVDTPDGFTYHYITDVSSDGKWFTGWGSFGLAADQSFVVFIPSPGALALLGVAGLISRRRRRS